MSGYQVRHEGARAAALLALVYLAGAGAVQLRPEGSSVATWWPAAGLAAALLVLGPRRRWGWYAAATTVVVTLANLTGGRDLPVSVLFGLANAAEALVVASVVRRGRRPSALLDSPEDLFRLVVACGAGALTLAACVAGTVQVTGGDGLEAARTAAPAHLAATLVILPLMMLRRALRGPRRRRLELVAQGTLLLATTLVVFWPDQPLALTFLPLPLLIWAALRFTPYVAAAEIVVLGVLSTWLTGRGDGPFAVGARSVDVDALVAGAQVQLFLVAAALMTMTSALASAQRAQLLRRLKSERDLTTMTLEATAAVILVLDGEGTIRRTNPTTSRLLGFDDDDLVGKTMWTTPMVPPERVEPIRRMFSSPDGSQVPRTREADLMHADGRRLRIVWNNSVVRDEHGQMVHAVFTGTDVTQERTTSGMLRHLLEAPMATALLGMDRAGRVTVLNRGAQEMLGRTTREVLGKPVEEVVASSQPRDYLHRVAGDGVRRPGDAPAEDLLDLAETQDWTWRDSAGRELTVSTTISVVTDAVGATIGYLCVGRDVTEQRRTQEMLEAALDKERHAVERLRRLDTAKTDFVSTVSHELHTPTTSIVGYTEMLRDGYAGEPTPEQVPMLDAIARNGARLIAVAGDLLTLSGLESGDRDWDFSPVDLTAVVTHGEEAIHPLVRERDLEVVFDVPDLAVAVRGDAGLLDRVLMNLHSNAVKFTPDGGSVGCSLHVGPTSVELVVSDTGIGIPEEEQGDLFSKFFRSSTAQSAAIQGTGLGLSIISSIVAAHDGHIDVRSRHGEGSTFTVRLPLLPTPDPTAGSTADPIVGPTAGLPSLSTQQATSA